MKIHIENIMGISITIISENSHTIENMIIIRLPSIAALSNKHFIPSSEVLRKLPARGEYYSDSIRVFT